MTVSEGFGEALAGVMELDRAVVHLATDRFNLNDTTYTVVWLALSLDPIDRKHAST